MVSRTRPAGKKREPFLQGDSWQLKPDTKINVFHWSVWERAQRGREKLERGSPVRGKKHWLGRRFCLSHLIQANWISLLAVKPFGNDVKFTVGMQSTLQSPGARTNQQTVQSFWRHSAPRANVVHFWSNCLHCILPSDIGEASTDCSQICVPLPMFG